jgi:ArsR family transcriptional regulator, arsenate/arsenite/antimonite-responsive transcriptional repressor
MQIYWRAKQVVERAVVDMEMLFKALADATRLRILGLLLTGEVCVCHIHESLRIPQPKASRHLAYLRRAGLVETRRDGLWIHYRLGKLADPVLAAIAGAVRHGLAHLDTVHRDAERLRRRTGCRVPTPGDVAGGRCCCSPQTGAVETEGAGARRR